MNFHQIATIYRRHSLIQFAFGLLGTAVALLWPLPFILLLVGFGAGEVQP